MRNILGRVLPCLLCFCLHPGNSQKQVPIPAYSSSLPGSPIPQGQAFYSLNNNLPPPPAPPNNGSSPVVTDQQVTDDGGRKKINIGKEKVAKKGKVT